jgi:hypothetical protein
MGLQSQCSEGCLTARSKVVKTCQNRPLSVDWPTVSDELWSKFHFFNPACQFNTTVNGGDEDCELV